MKHYKKLSALLVLAILAGLCSAAVPSAVIAQTPGPKMSVFELVTSPT